jgi:hypothetical protein
MSETPVKVIVDLSKPKGQRESIVPLTAEEIAERESRALQAAAEEQAQLEEEQRIASIKASARAKLVAGEPLTDEEASLLVI